MSNPAGITRVPRCVYCGRRTRGLICSEHADLPALDPDWKRFTLYRSERVDPRRGGHDPWRHVGRVNA